MPEPLTPQELAAELEAEAARMLQPIPDLTDPLGRPRHPNFTEGAIAGALREAAARIRERLAPAWDALAAERDEHTELMAQLAMDMEAISGLTAERDALAAESVTRLAENARMREELASAAGAFGRLTDDRDRYLAALEAIVSLIADGEDDETLLDIRRIAREALEGGHG